jgi:hypothetical protein
VRWHTIGLFIESEAVVTDDCVEIAEKRCEHCGLMSKVTYNTAVVGKWYRAICGPCKRIIESAAEGKQWDGR